MIDIDIDITDTTVVTPCKSATVMRLNTL